MFLKKEGKNINEGKKCKRKKYISKGKNIYKRREKREKYIYKRKKIKGERK